jgi:hypothetical protein
MACPPSASVFQRRPLLIFSVVYGLLIALLSSALGLLQTLSERLEQTTHMSRVVADPKFSPNHLCHPLTRPQLSSKAVSLSSLSHKLGQFRSLIFTQTWRCARRRLVSQGLHALLPGTLHPLAYCSFTNPQSVGYLRLLPALFLQLEGA